MDLKIKEISLIAVTLLVSACSSPTKMEFGRKVVDNSLHGKDLPEWSQTSQVSWIEGDSVIFKGEYTVRGDQRTNACYDLASLEMQQKILAEIESTVKAELNLAQEGISESADALMTKSIQSQMLGRIRGLRATDQVYERYQLASNERIDCFVRAQMKQQDYQALKSSVLSQMLSVSDEVAKRVRDRQADFFKQEPAMTAKTATKDE